MSPGSGAYQVVINHEEQYSIWPARLRPTGDWRATGREGPRKELQRYVEEVWTDMRPLSVRRQAERLEDPRYRVVINHEEQYSIWLADRDFEPGWKDTGQRGGLRECQRYIEEVWTDMRPLSLRD